MAVGGATDVPKPVEGSGPPGGPGGPKGPEGTPPPEGSPEAPPAGGEVTDDGWGFGGSDTPPHTPSGSDPSHADSASHALLTQIRYNSATGSALLHEAASDHREVETGHQADLDTVRAEAHEGHASVEHRATEARVAREGWSARYTSLLSGRSGTGPGTGGGAPTDPRLAHGRLPLGTPPPSGPPTPSGAGTPPPPHSAGAPPPPGTPLPPGGLSSTHVAGGRTPQQQAFMNALQARMLSGEATPEEATLYQNWLNAMEEDPSCIPPDIMAQFTGEDVEERREAHEGDAPHAEGEGDASSGAGADHHPVAADHPPRTPDPQGALSALAHFNPPPLRRRPGGAGGSGEGEAPAVVSYTAASEGASILFGADTAGGAEAHGLRQARTGMAMLEGGVGVYVNSDMPVHSILYGGGNAHDAIPMDGMAAGEDGVAPTHILRSENPTRVDGLIIRSPDGHSAIAMTDDMIMRMSRESLDHGGDGSFDVHVGGRPVHIAAADVHVVASSAGIRREMSARASGAYGVTMA